MSNKLIRVPEESPLVKRINPQVQTTAKPEADWLLQARADMSRDPDLRDLLIQARDHEDPEWGISRMTARLAALWEEGVGAEQIRECIHYLRDEFTQLGEGTFIVSKTTGKTVAVLTEEDIWQPKAVPRVDGSMATPLKRIRPDLEGLLYVTLSEDDREQRILAALVKRAAQTDLMIEEGDPRLLPATKEGRRQMVAAMGTYEPEVLLRSAGGTSGAFLRHFDLAPEATFQPKAGLAHVSGVASTRSVTAVQDQTTMNLRHDRAAAIRGAAVQGWVREMAKALSRTEGAITEVEESALTSAVLGDATFWVCPPNVVSTLRRVSPSLTVMPVEGCETLVGLRGKVGTIVVPPMFETAGLERFDRWEVLTAVPFDLWFDPASVRLLAISGVAHQGVVL